MPLSFWAEAAVLLTLNGGTVHECCYSENGEQIFWTSQNGNEAKVWDASSAWGVGEPAESPTAVRFLWSVCEVLTL